MDGDRAVEEFLLDQQRRADDQHRGQSAARLRDLAQRGLSGVEQRILVEEVLVRVAGEPQFRKNGECCVGFISAGGQSDGAFGVPDGVAEPN